MRIKRSWTFAGTIAKIVGSATVAVTIALVPWTARAQNSASASVTAQVQQPITVTKTNDLSFGAVFPGVNATVAPTAAGAAAFTIAGQASSGISMTFTLPTTLTSGANTLSINGWSGIFNTTQSPTGGTTFTPATTATSATLGSSGNLYVYVGASVAPTIAQAAGTYTGTLTITVVYP